MIYWVNKDEREYVPQPMNADKNLTHKDFDTNLPYSSLVALYIWGEVNKDLKRGETWRERVKVLRNAKGYLS